MGYRKTIKSKIQFFYILHTHIKHIIHADISLLILIRYIPKSQSYIVKFTFNVFKRTILYMSTDLKSIQV